MEDPFAALDQAVAEARRAWRTAMGGAAAGFSGAAGGAGAAGAAGGAPGFAGGHAAQVDAMSEAGIVEVNEKLAIVRRHVDALHAPVAAGIAERSAASRGSDGISRKNGHRSPVKLIAAATGGHAGDAARLIQVGEATAGRMTFTGQRTEPKRPHVAEGMAAGSLSVAAAAAIVKMLDKLSMRVDPVTLEEAEQTLVQQAGILSLDELNAVLRRAEAVLDPDGLEPKIDQLRAERSLTIREDPNGMIVISGRFDPEHGAPIKTAVEAIVTHELRTSRGHNVVDGDDGADAAGGAGCAADGSGGAGCGADGSATCCAADGTGGAGCGADGSATCCAPDCACGGAGRAPEGAVIPETRSVVQMQADALATICRHMLGCDSDDVPLESTMVVVRMPLEAVLDGTGVATIDGISQPIDAGTARRMAAGAKIIPCVLGTDSEVLDLGRAKRFFSSSQRIAFGERDGGCASCGLPPSMCEAHHILWWDLHGGKTDLANGILLCTACHHRIHIGGWEIRIDPPPSGDVTGGTVWFIPPSDVDPDRRPRLGGRKRFDYTHKFHFGRAA